MTAPARIGRFWKDTEKRRPYPLGAASHTWSVRSRISPRTGGLYERNADNSARFVLGTVGDNPLVCFGVNPSTAEPDKLDRTLQTVNKVAAQSGFDSFIMLNVYPQRAKDPNGIHAAFDSALKSENERQISTVIGGRNLTLWAVWGALIGKRRFLPMLLKDILDLPALSERAWVSRGSVSRAGHPHHPLYVKDAEVLNPFSVSHYR
jgi:hypothetical protein